MGFSETFREVCGSVRVRFPDGRTVMLGAEDIASMTLTDGTDAGFLPGCVLSAQFVLTLRNDEGQWLYGGEKRGYSALNGAELRPFLNCGEEEAALGVFTVLSAEGAEAEGTVVLSASDSIGTTLGEAFTDGMSYSCTLEALFRHWLSQTGFTFDGIVPNGAGRVSRRPAWSGMDLRTAGGAIAQAAGCFLRLDETGRLELAKWGSDAMTEIGPDRYFSLRDGMRSWGPIRTLNAGAVVVSNDEAYGETVRMENPVVTSGMTALLSGTLTQFSDMRLNRLTIEWTGDPSVRVGSRIAVTDLRGRRLTALVTKRTITWDGSMSMECVCGVPE